jgi:hypothetical protein
LRRLHLFEFEDLYWFPAVIRRGMTDYLRFVMETLGAYKPAVPVLLEALEASPVRKITDLCSGAGGGMLGIAEALKVPVILTDKYPNLPAFRDLSSKNPCIGYRMEPVDALDLPGDVSGVLTVFTAFHHFKPEQADRLLKSAVRQKMPVCIFEGAGRSLAGALSMIIVIPILALAAGPFIRPVSVSRLIFTYFIPLIPLCTLWDGFASFLKLYKPEELLRMTVSYPGYRWRAGTLKHRLGFRLVYLSGIPQA